jgi:hypothetical protein
MSSNTISDKDLEIFKKNIGFMKDVNSIIDKTFGSLVSKEACNALYIIAESMYKSLLAEEKQWVFDKSNARKD